MDIYSSITSSPEKFVTAEDAEILRNSRRRGVIKALDKNPSTLNSIIASFLNSENPKTKKKEEVVEKVARWETGKSLELIDESTLNGVASTIHQTHIPRLEEADVVNYHQDECLLEPAPNIEKYTQFVEERPSRTSPFPTLEIESDCDLTADEGFDILSNERRQYALSYLKNPPKEEVTLRDLSDFTALMEHGGNPSDAERKSAYSTLLQYHIPRMDDLDIVEYQNVANIIEKGEHFDVISDYLPETLNTS